MLKNKYLILIFLFIFLLFFLVLPKNYHKQNAKPTSLVKINSNSDSMLPSQAVMNFYGTYLMHKGDLKSLDSFSENIYLTDSFKEKIKKEISENNSFNPITCLQGKPDEIKVHSATVSSNFAEVLVTEKFESIKKNQRIKLTLSQDGYRIYDIICN